MDSIFTHLIVVKTTVITTTTNTMVLYTVSNKEMQDRLPTVALVRHLLSNCRGIQLLSLLQATFSHILIFLQTHPLPMPGTCNIKNILARGSLLKHPFQSKDPIVMQLVMPLQALR